MTLLSIHIAILLLPKNDFLIDNHVKMGTIDSVFHQSLQIKGPKNVSLIKKRPIVIEWFDEERLHPFSCLLSQSLVSSNYRLISEKSHVTTCRQ